MRGKEEIKKTIEEGKAVLGIEFGSTRIKAVLIDEDKSPIASGSYDWENQLVDNIPDIQHGENREWSSGMLPGSCERCRSKI